jgi:hypothetical protein
VNKNQHTAPTSAINITLNLSAPQADALMDALQTFAPHIRPELRPTPGHNWSATLRRELIPATWHAVATYAAEILPGESATRGLLTKLNSAIMLSATSDQQTAAALAEFRRLEPQTQRAVIGWLALSQSTIPLSEAEELRQRAALQVWLNNNPRPSELADQFRATLARRRARLIVQVMP